MSPRRWFNSRPARAGRERTNNDDIGGEGDAPLRAELLSAEQMEEHGRALARQHRIVDGARSNSLLLRLADNETVLRGSCALLAGAIKLGHRITPAGEWLLDNLYLIDEQIRTARRHFPQRYSWELPRLERGASAGLPRVYDIALNAISHGDGRVDQDSFSRFVHAYEDMVPLALGELWAIPIMLRLALIENLRRVAVRVRSDRNYRNLAARWADQMIEVAESDPKSLILVVSDMARSQPPMRGAFVAELVRRLQGHSGALALPLTWIEQRLQEAGLTIEQLVNATNQEEAADQVSISNSIGSLRLLEATDWRAFVEQASHVERILREDPAAVYPHMDFATRDSYRHVVEQIAREARRTELEVAACAIALAQAADAGDAEAAVHRHVGYYLIDAGTAQLEARCELPRKWASWRTRTFPFPLYFGALVLVGALFALPPLIDLLRAPIPGWLAAITIGCALIALSQLAVALVNLLASLTVIPEPLPRMDFRDGIAPEAETLVVVPCLLGSAAEASELVDELEIRFLANRDPHLRYALLTDFADAGEQETDSDAYLLAITRNGIETLNTRYAATDADRFFLLHRPRRWCESERCWIGFERKRGKLGELNALLRGRGAERFSCLVGDVAHLRGTRYVITLDADTQLPRNAARELVAAMEHPLNRPRFDAGKRRVVAGYGILQPRIGTSFAADSNSRYAMLFGGDRGLDPYTRAVSDTYQDLFGEGSFTGKGIYEVDTFERALADRFPTSRILSHDLLEGCYARSGLLTDVELFEGYPPSYRLDAKRRRRWIRGDWQIAEWLLPRVPTADGGRERNPLCALARWKIFDNLRRSLVPPALLALLLLGWSVLAQPGYWTLLVLEIVLLPALLDIALAVARKPPEVGLHRHLLLSAHDAGRRLAQFAFGIACLPYEAWVSLDAIVRTGWRVHVSRRHLLQWIASRAAGGERAAGLTPTLWVAPLVALVVVVVLLLHAPHALPVAAPWLLLWLLAPGLERWLARSPTLEDDHLDAAQRHLLRRAARRTWAFFEEFVGADDNWLPPDNYQEQPIAKVAQRTSPTNIGLALLANLAAYDFGYLGLARLLERTSQTFDTLCQLERYNGHFYNWYDTRHPATAASALRVHGRQRQSARAPVHTAPGPAAARRCAVAAPAAVHRAGRFLRRADRGLRRPRRRRTGGAAREVRRHRTRAAQRRTREPRRPARTRGSRRTRRARAVLADQRGGPRGRPDARARMPRGARRPARLVAGPSGRGRGADRGRGRADSDPHPAGALRPRRPPAGGACRGQRDARARMPARDRAPRRGLPGAGAGRLPLPVRAQAASVRDRLQRQRGATRQRLLRPARLRGAPRHFRLDRARADPAGQLVFAGAPADRTRRAADPAVVERLDVRVPDAAAGDADLSRLAAGRNQPRRGRAPDRLRARAGRAVGHFRIRLQPDRRRAELPIPRLRRARPRPAARPVAGTGDCALRQCAGADGDAARGRGQPAHDGRARLADALRILRGDRLHADPPGRPARRMRSCARSWPTTRA